MTPGHGSMQGTGLCMMTGAGSQGASSPLSFVNKHKLLFTPTVITTPQTCVLVCVCGYVCEWECV